MTHSFGIEFEPAITSFVTVALVPVDRFTRREVRAGVSVELWDTDKNRALPYQLIRNRSGYFILSDQPREGLYTFRINAAAAGYSGPIDFIANPAADGLRQIVWLDRSPSFSFDPETTLVRGTVVIPGEDPASSAGLDGATVSIEGERFQTSSDARGSFALAMEPPAPAAGEPAQAFERQVSIAHPDHETRVLTVTLEAGRTHIFSEPIAIDGSDESSFTE